MTTGRSRAAVRNGTRNTPRSWLFWIGITIAASFLLTGCLNLKDTRASQEHLNEVIIQLKPGEVYKQTFRPSQSGFNGISVYVNLAEGEISGSVEFALALQSTPSEIITHQIFPLSSSSTAEPLSLEFALQENSHMEGYLITLSSIEGIIELYGTSLDRYGYGSSSVGSHPLKADLAFELQYKYTWRSFLYDLTQNLNKLPIWLISLLALYLPGWLIHRILQPRPPSDPILREAVKIGFGLAFYPLLILWSSIIGIAWSSAHAWGLVLLAGGGLLIFHWLEQKQSPISQSPNINSAPTGITHPKPAWLATIFLILLGSVLQVRFMMVRDLAGPPWVDSVHHGLLVQLISETGRLPTTYAPYIPGVEATYHSGYHIIQSYFQWLSGFDLIDAMLIFGQILSSLSILGVYALTVVLTRKPLAGLFASLISGLLMPMPAYYTSWGRYPHLAAVILLPIAFIITRRIYKLKEVHWRSIVGAVILSGGLFLVHYQVSVFYALLVFIDLCKELIIRRSNAKSISNHSSIWWIPIVHITGIAALTLILLFPWLLEIVPDLVVPKIQTWSANRQPLFSGFSWAFINTAYGKYANILAILGLGWSIVRRRKFGWLLILWVSLMFAMANLAAIGLPGGGLINNLQVEITLFLPLAVLGGYFLSEFVASWWNHANPQYKPLVTTLFLGATICLGIFATREQVTILNPVTFLLRQPDREAIKWIDQNIHPEEAILITPFNWGYGIFAGQDGGYWISPITLNPTYPPPVLYGLSNDQALINTIVSFSQEVLENQANPQKISDLMREKNIRYFYLGARPTSWDPKMFIASDYFATQYASKGVWIFKRLDTP